MTKAPTPTENPKNNVTTQKCSTYAQFVKFTRMAAFKEMLVSPAKHRVMRLPKKFD